jgi:pre-mRNA-processing factor 17
MSKAREKTNYRKRKLIEREAEQRDDGAGGIWAPYDESAKADERKLTAEEVAQIEAASAKIAAAQVLGNCDVDCRSLTGSDRLQDEAKKDRGETFDEEVDFDRMVERKVSHLLPPRLASGHEQMPATSKFHGKEETDYQGRSWAHPPTDLKPDEDGEHAAFIPKRCIHKWAGHSKGVQVLLRIEPSVSHLMLRFRFQAIEFFPNYGHLLLSCSMDNTVRERPKQERRRRQCGVYGIMLIRLKFGMSWVIASSSARTVATLGLCVPLHSGARVCFLLWTFSHSACPAMMAPSS